MDLSTLLTAQELVNNSRSLEQAKDEIDALVREQQEKFYEYASEYPDEARDLILDYQE